MTTSDIKVGLFVYGHLKKISHKINSLDCKRCNGTVKDNNYEKRLNFLLNKAETILKTTGQDNLKLFHQSDPRGSSLYILDKEMNNENYHQGLSVF